VSTATGIVVDASRRIGTGLGFEYGQAPAPAGRKGHVTWGIGKGDGRLTEEGDCTRVGSPKLDEEFVFENEELERKDRDNSQRRMEVA
jgi:hypothetical protein